MKLHRQFLLLHERYGAEDDGETGAQVTLAEVAETLDCTHRSALTVIGKMAAANWIGWSSKRGRGRRSGLTFRVTPEEIAAASVADAIGRGDVRGLAGGLGDGAPPPAMRERLRESLRAYFGHHSETRTGRQIDTLRLPIRQRLHSLDPLRTNLLAESFVVGHVFDGLVRQQGGSDEILPALAHHWECGEDGTAWTFYLRKDVPFHDGRLLTADDVVHSFERMRRLPERMLYGFMFRNIAEVTAPGPLVVRFRLKRAHALFLPFLCTSRASIVPLRRGDEPVALRPIGTGPFRVAAFDPGLCVLEAHVPHYAGRAHLDRVEIVNLPWRIAGGEDGGESDSPFHVWPGGGPVAAGTDGEAAREDGGTAGADGTATGADNDATGTDSDAARADGGMAGKEGDDEAGSGAAASAGAERGAGSLAEAAQPESGDSAAGPDDSGSGVMRQESAWSRAHAEVFSRKFVTCNTKSGPLRDPAERAAVMAAISAEDAPGGAAGRREDAADAATAGAEAADAAHLGAAESRTRTGSAGDGPAAEAGGFASPGLADSAAAAPAAEPTAERQPLRLLTIPQYRKDAALLRERLERRGYACRVIIVTVDDFKGRTRLAADLILFSLIRDRDEQLRLFDLYQTLSEHADSSTRSFVRSALRRAAEETTPRGRGRELDRLEAFLIAQHQLHILYETPLQTAYLPGIRGVSFGAQGWIDLRTIWFPPGS
ncbi:ABC transporter substrate-binding protein [Saccharibacillus brassicae]|uniref:ABC transporter substrate-binding protein n=1 Tax=Saccharibacillus brassicae TaxID=2583377 RepID=A0A4Y6UVA4_SACBS|nr:ABC transporter substrate-binding protein [Saccharibacillus brassicae]QDH21064.1 hypothetical protein FFV09_09495 [Saccharibacillus brassicae]